MEYTKHIGIIALALSSLLISCGSTKDITTAEVEHPAELSSVEFTTIVRNELSGAGEEGLVQSMIVVRTQEEWEALKEKMNKVNNETDAFETPEFVDFSSEMLIACFDRVRSTGGYDLHVNHITESTDTMNVFIELAIPAGAATSVLTQPYSIIKLTKTDKTIVETRW
ncbi:MAG: protease complex subunit PrcB family protein [Crocinitomicaceae bacterium]|nr:protease complex subunit PrcB family protein [Crocinitomicaceae bacterium]